MLYDSKNSNYSGMVSIDEALFGKSISTQESGFFKSHTYFLNNVPPKLNMDQFLNLSNVEFSFQINGED